MWKNSRAQWLLNFGIWTLIGLFFSSQTYVLHTDTNAAEVYPWQKWFLGEFIYCYIFAIFTPLIVRFVKCYPIKRQRTLPGLLIHISASLLLSMVIKALHATISTIIFLVMDKTRY